MEAFNLLRGVWMNQNLFYEKRKLA
uniref:Uncharacterized protein n=1 Tax=Arundo donax TaxID=35708 RepID=A0A0A9A1W9_ARUDO